MKKENFTREELIELVASLQAENETLNSRILQLEVKLKASREFSKIAAEYAGNGIDAAHRFAKMRRKRIDGADKTHAEHRAMKAEIFIWLNSRVPKFKLIEDAATAIVGQVPIKHTTAKTWFKEWKKMQSASTP